ncbi:MAG TPA: hypothetical protein VKR58_05605, partial [Aquella sp.]|nr:hypothetical protein [Aquella sp.]
SSNYKGVSYNKDPKAVCKYRAKITIGYKQINLGSFLLEIDAAKAYNEKARELFGEFANLNKIEETDGQ